MDIGSLFYKYQILIAGFVGFTGVVISLLYNGKLAREQRADEARDARAQRDEERAHERDTVRAALLSELKINRDAVESNRKAVEEEARTHGPGDGVLVPTEALDNAYRTFLPRIGLLPESELRAVMYAYLSLQSHHASLVIFGAGTKITDQYVLIDSVQAVDLVGVLEELLTEIDKAITALEAADGCVGVRRLADRP